MATAKTLPRIYFRVEPAPVPATLPRMDIAAFVGFAASGPLDIPVPIEDAARLQEIFGSDLELPWSSESGEFGGGQLTPAVRAFFRNGGRRCWVVRVADRNEALANRFLVPGLLRVSESGYAAAVAEARSEGSWSDGLKVNAMVETASVAAKDFLRAGDEEWPQGLRNAATWATSLKYCIRLASGERARVAHGDLLRIELPEPNLTIFFPVDTIMLNESNTLVGAQHAFFFAATDPSELGAASKLFLLSGAAPRPGPEVALSEVRTLDFTWDPTAHAFRISKEQAAGIQAGSWLSAMCNTPLLARVSNVETNGDAQVSCDTVWRDLSEDAGWKMAGAFPNAISSVITFALRVRDSQRSVGGLTGLGFVPGNASYWAWLPSDAQLYAINDNPLPSPADSLRAAADHTRFPLAGLNPEDTYLPLGMPPFYKDEFAQPALGAPDPATSIARDGLAKITDALFIDPDLAGLRGDNLLEKAFFVQYQLPKPNVRRLRGIHALLGIEEASILSIPDASQREFQFLRHTPVVLSPPELSATGIELRWTWPTNAEGFTLQRSCDPRFSMPEIVYEGPDNRFIPKSAPCLHTEYFRIQAQGAGTVSPWSNTVTLRLPPKTFERCGIVLVSSPKLTIDLTGDSIELRWSAPVQAAATFLLDMSGDPGFEQAHVLYEGAAQCFSMWNSLTRVAYFRVAAQEKSGRNGPWSNTVQTPAAPWQGYQTSRPHDNLDDSPRADRMLAIHQAMLRLCAARGDMVAVLSCAHEHNLEAALDYKTRLVARILQQDDMRTLSFGALYHPWLVESEAAGAGDPSLLSVPPDGGVAGVYARRALAEGAWVAPAGRVLQSVVALEPSMRGASPDLFAAQINPIHQQPYGFTVYGAETLSGDPEMLDVSVRRLMILLRRLALREGVKNVFEPNDGAFRRKMQRQFDALLQDLFRRGAFAGATPAEGFRVVTDDSVNPPESRELGRFIVELRVAPSRPLQFLTVRLLQSGGETIFLEEWKGA